MRLRDACALAALTALLAAGCSRLTFIRLDTKRTDGEQVQPEYNVSDSPATKQRVAARDRIALATQRLRSGDLEVAQRESHAALKINPDSADAHTILGIVAERQGRSAEAGQHYQRAAELAPGQGAALSNYGAWLCTHGFPAESLVWFDRAIAAPNNAPASALANAGGCALKVGQYDRAQRDLRKALALDPANGYALASMAENEYRLNRNFEARAFSERRLAAAPANAAVLQLAADIETKLGDRVAASRYLQRLRAEFPGDVAATSGEATKP